MNTACIIPVAGLSTRMGIFKPLLLLDSKALIAHTVASAFKGGVDSVYVVLGREAKQVREALNTQVGELLSECLNPASTNAMLHYVVNPDFEQTDMLHSIKLALEVLTLSAEYARTEAIFILPGDTPLVTAETFALLQSYACENPDARVIRPVNQGRTGHPMLLNKSSVETILTFTGTGGLRAALAAYTPCDVIVNDAGILLDADTPADWQGLQAYAAGQQDSSTALK